MKEFDRERAHRKSEDLSHLKDEVDEKNTEHIDRARQVPRDGGDRSEDGDGDAAEQASRRRV
ncbi:hypothetical protein OG618_03365 [Kitasatospora sp. NBC_01246]|uniref:hypothetical protein n=1 Tax=Kitasatospora sp. NBC_01246 TaxID=2903570 RepID=UPI002E31E6A2|nr:hypothetical protein [Kitasatospora sp. NBC_01246]